MNKIGVASLLVLSLALAACGGYTEVNPWTTGHQGTQGGDMTVGIDKANGTIVQDMELEGHPNVTLEVDVTLAVGKGSYKIELLGKDQEVTLSLEARDGQTVNGHGQMVTDSFGEASYRVTAVDAENVDYALEYIFQ